jgi:hypothetical protein
MTSQSNRWRIAASCCFPVGADTTRVCASIARCDRARPGPVTTPRRRDTNPKFRHGAAVGAAGVRGSGNIPGAPSPWGDAVRSERRPAGQRLWRLSRFYVRKTGRRRRTATPRLARYALSSIAAPAGLAVGQTAPAIECQTCPITLRIIGHWGYQKAIHSNIMPNSARRSVWPGSEIRRYGTSQPIDAGPAYLPRRTLYTRERTRHYSHFFQRKYRYGPIAAQTISAIARG